MRQMRRFPEPGCEGGRGAEGETTLRQILKLEAKQEDVLGSVRIASPCKASWDLMQGDYRVRHCEACQHKVYNLSGMTRTEAETLVAGTEGRLCVRFYRRPDGTMLTQDCPVGVMAVRKRMAVTLACAATLFLSLSSYAGNLARSKPVETIGKTDPMSAYQQARRIETLRIVLDRLYPPPPVPAPVFQHTAGMISVGRINRTPKMTASPPPTGKH